MQDHSPPVVSPNPREVYDAPRVLEDLPLETFSLACDPGKAAGICDLDGLDVAT